MKKLAKQDVSIVRSSPAEYLTFAAATTQHSKRNVADRELEAGSVIKQYLTTAADGRQYSNSRYRIVQDRLFQSDFDRFRELEADATQACEPQGSEF